MSVDARARAGLFLGDAVPGSEVPGVSASPTSSVRRPPPSAVRHRSCACGSRSSARPWPSLDDGPHLRRAQSVNEGFSGGEKKRQRDPPDGAAASRAIALLDEIDSGLDVDALRVVVSAGINAGQGRDQRRWGCCSSRTTRGCCKLVTARLRARHGPATAGSSRRAGPSSPTHDRRGGLRPLPRSRRRHECGRPTLIHAVSNAPWREAFPSEIYARCGP